MALSSATITYDIADLVGNDFDARRTKVWVSTNIDSGVIADTVGNQIRVGDGLGDIAEDGTGSVSVWVPGTGSNPASWQTYLHFDYAQRRPGGARERLTFGPFTVTADANLADLIQEQEVPPTYLSTVTELLQGYVDSIVNLSGISTSDGVVGALINGTAGAGPLTRDALSTNYAPLEEQFETVTAYIYGHSWTNAVAGPDAGSWFFSRACSRLRTAAASNQGQQGTLMTQIADRIRSTHTPNLRGLRCLVGAVNDANNSILPATTAESFRTAMALLTARYVATATSLDFLYGPGWTSGSVSASGAWVDFSWNGDEAYLLVQGASSTGAQFTLKKNDGTTTAYDVGGTGGGIAPVRAIRLSGYGAGDHTVRLTTTSATACTVIGATVPNANAPTVVWLKEPALTGFDSTKNARMASAHTAMATVAADFPSAVAVTTDAGWNGATMLGADGIHPNDRGNVYLARLVLAALAAQTYREGQNFVTVATPPTYTPPDASLNPPGATAPGAPTSFVATAANQVSFTWAQPTSDGGASITNYRIESSPASAGTWTTLTTVDERTFSATVTTGLTEATSYDFRVKAINAVGAGTASSTQTVTAGAEPAVYAADTFTRTASNAGSTTTGGYAWAASGDAAWNTNGSVLTLGTVQTTGDGHLVINDTHANGTVKAKFVTASNLVGLSFRMASDNLTGWVLYRNSSTSWFLRKKTAASTYTTIQTITTPAAAVGDVVEVVLSGSTIKVRYNGAIVGSTTTDAANSTQTRQGLYGATLSAQFDDFEHNSITA